MQIPDDPPKGQPRRGPNRPHWGYIDTAGQFVIPAKFSDLGKFVDGLAFAREYGGRYGYIDMSGQYAIAPQFDPIRDTPAFKALVAEAQAGRQRALEAYREAGGELLLAR